MYRPRGTANLSAFKEMVERRAEPSGDAMFNFDQTSIVPERNNALGWCAAQTAEHEYSSFMSGMARHPLEFQTTMTVPDQRN